MRSEHWLEIDVANVWVAGDRYFFELVANNVESLASRFESQELSLFGYNIFNKSLLVVLNIVALASWAT